MFGLNLHKNKAPQVTMLVAYTKNGRVIGNQGKIPWKLASERDRCKELTAGKSIIMGRTSFEEIGHALPYCTIIILSKTMRSVPSGCLLAHSLNKALKLCKNEILIAGGQEIYQQTINIATKVYATEIEADFDGDRFFPELQGNWKRTVEARKEEAGIKYEYVYYEKISEQEK